MFEVLENDHYRYWTTVFGKEKVSLKENGTILLSCTRKMFVSVWLCLSKPRAWFFAMVDYVCILQDNSYWFEM